MEAYYVENSGTDQMKKHQMNKKSDNDAAIPLSLTTMIQGTMLMMATFLALFGYRACYQGEFECSL